MTHASLFSGIGGFDLAAEWMGWENIFHCEWNPFGQKVLSHHFPNSKSYNDITKTDFSIHKGTVDILTGGFPCQPYSLAGKRLGKKDERHLFPEMLRAVEEIQPTWVVGENVLGIVNWGGGVVFNEVQTDLENKGYEVQAYILPAAGVNAPHKRERIWFIAYTNLHNDKSKIRKFNEQENRIPKKYRSQNNTSRKFSRTNIKINDSNSNSKRCEWEWQQGVINKERQKSNKRFRQLGNFQHQWDEFPSQSPICGGDDGLPKELDNITFSKWRRESIKAYGNAIVPQVAFEIFKAIEKYDNIVK